MRRLRIGEKNVRVRDEGEGARAPLVCVHGAGASSVVFMDLVRRFASQRRVIALDLPAHGQSDAWREPSQVSIDLYRDAVGAVAATLGVSRAVLVGHSLGALVCLAAAAAWPERVAGVCVVGGGARLPVSAGLLELLEKDYVRFGEWMKGRVWSRATPRDVVDRWSAIALSARQEVTLADFRAVDRFDATPLLSSIQAPALVLIGADDHMTPPALSAELVSRLAGARLVLVPEAGHMLMQEQPKRFFEELAEFLVTVL